MANVNSISSNSYSSSSIYGTRNVLSGLASGMDTEAMIENAVSGYQTKITQLQQQQEKLTWKQDAYRDITDKLIALNQNYTSFTSKTNLYGESFFLQSDTATLGTSSDLVSATGRAEADVVIKSATLATAAQYRINASALGFNPPSEKVSWDSDVSNLTGSSITLSTGSGEGESVTLKLDNQSYSSYRELADGFNDMLQNAGNSSITASYDAGSNQIKFAAVGKNVKVEGVSGSLAGFATVAGSTSGVLNMNADKKDDLTTKRAEYLSEKSISVTLDGTKKTFSLGKYESTLSGEDLKKEVLKDIKDNLDKEFGTGRIAAAFDANGALTFTLPDNNKAKSSLQVVSNVGGELGISNSFTNYLNTGRTLGDLGVLSGTEKQDLVINGKTVGSYGADDSLSTILGDISRSDAGVLVTFSKLTGDFQFTAKETGAASSVTFGDGLATTLFRGTTATATAGTDAQITVSVNGGKDMALQRASNTFDLEGMSVTVKDAFKDGKVSFHSTSDTSSILEGIKSFVSDYNAIATQIHEAIKTKPAEKNASTHTTYDPLTEKDKEGMSESAIEKYEEKAKQGILFNDTNLKMLDSRLTDIVSTGAVSQELAKIGVTATYSNGYTTLTVDEDKLSAALQSDASKVAELFNKVSSNSGSSNIYDSGDGIITKLKKTLDEYASTSLTNPGILVREAGTKRSSTSLLNNTLQSRIDSFSDKISSWQTKMSSKIDYYTRQFTALEKLMNTANTQSSALAGMMGY